MFIGILYSNAAKNKKEFSLFMVSFYLFFFLISLILPSAWEFMLGAGGIPLQTFPVKSVKIVSFGELLNLSLCMVPSTIFTSAGFFMFAVAVRKGPLSVAWGIMQAAIILPFLSGWLLFGDNINIVSIVGILIIILALIFMVKGKQLNQNEDANTPVNRSKDFLFWAFAAFLLTGLGQVLSLLPNKFTVIFPSEMPLSNEVLTWRVPISALCGFLMWFIIGAATRIKFSLNQIKNGFNYAAVVFWGHTVLYIAIDLLAKYNLSGLAYPLAMGCCIVLFSLFCRIVRSEKLHNWESAGLIVLTLGLFILAFAGI